MAFDLTSAASLLPTARSAWKTLEAGDDISGSLTISLSATAPLHHGDMKIQWEVSLSCSNASGYRCYEVTGQDLEEVLQEIAMRYRRDNAKAPLCLSRDAREA